MLLDIEGVINWVKEKGYQELILEGHGYGCNKILYYYTKNGKIATETYYYDFLPGGEENLIRYMGGKNGKSKVLNNIDIPVLIVFGDVDE